MGGSEPLVWILRHGETEWSRSGQHTSRTDLDLTEEGRHQATALGTVLRGTDFDLVLCSPRKRAQETAELSGLVPYTVTDDLREWDYGRLEGLTTPQIQDEFPGWTIWDGPWPDGETPSEVGSRADRLIADVLSSHASRVALVGHGHFSRVLAARWVGAGVGAGSWLDLDTATLSQLGWARNTQVIRYWNLPAVRS